MNYSFPQPRPASIEDITKVVAIEALDNRPPWSAAAFTQELTKPHSHFWVMTDDETDEIVYSYIVFSFTGEQAHIQTLGVGRKYRRHGVASAMLRAVIKFLMKKNATSIYLELRKSNTAALALYQHLGFVVLRTAKALYPDGEDAYTMIYKMEREKLAKPEPAAEDSDDDRHKNFN